MSGEQQVLRQAQAGHSATAQALFGHKVQAQRAALVGVELAHGLAAECDGLGLRTTVFARQGKQQLALPVARHASNAHHLACTHLQVDAVEVDPKRVIGLQAEVFHL